MKKLDDKELKNIDGGSTRIVARSQTLKSKDRQRNQRSNTIRVSSSNTGLAKAAKPFKINLKNSKKNRVENK